MLYNGTKKIDSNLNNTATMFINLDSSIQPHTIRDTIRRGKYKSSGHPRPLLVTLNRSSDVNIILSKWAKVKPPYVIKPDLQRKARVIESHLLKVWWSLILTLKYVGTKFMFKENFRSGSMNPQVTVTHLPKTIWTLLLPTPLPCYNSAL